MHPEVQSGIDELKRQFGSEITCAEDGQGGAYVIVERVQLGPTFSPSETWMGAHIPPQYPYADIYPVFIGGDVRRTNGVALQAPITLGATFQARQAIQISRKNNAIGDLGQTALGKFLKVLDFLLRS